MKNISVLIKPASSLCNIECSYCFYNTIAEEREIASYGFMELSTLENIVKKAFEFSEGGSCTFAFQGGEPTLIGLDFFKKFIEFQNKYKDNSFINNVIQTNGILIDDEWAAFLKENKFLVGLSLDGPQKVHDARRKGKDNKGTFHSVMKAKRIMDRYKVEYNVLSVVDTTLARNVKEVYEFFKKEKIAYTQYIACLDPLMSENPMDKTNLSPKTYATFLKKLFDLWYKDFMKGKYVSIRYFDNLINIILGRTDEACDMKGHCSIQNVIEADGSIYPCDFYVYDRWNLGNINDNTFEDIIGSDKAREFLSGSLAVADKCNLCKWKHICRGGCRRNRENPENLNTLCEAYDDFFEYTASRLMEVAMKIKNQNMTGVK